MPSQRVAVAVLLSNFCEFAGSQSIDFSDPPELKSLINSLSFSESLEFAAKKKQQANNFPRIVRRDIPVGCHASLKIENAAIRYKGK